MSNSDELRLLLANAVFWATVFALAVVAVVLWVRSQLADNDRETKLASELDAAGRERLAELLGTKPTDPQLILRAAREKSRVSGR